MPKQYDVNSWEGLVACLQNLPAVDIACRGQEQRYSDIIKSRFDRCLELTGLQERLRVERAVSQRFREHSAIYL